MEKVMDRRKIIAETKLRLIRKHIAYFSGLAKAEEDKLKKIKITLDRDRKVN